MYNFSLLWVVVMVIGFSGATAQKKARFFFKEIFSSRDFWINILQKVSNYAKENDYYFNVWLLIFEWGLNRINQLIGISLYWLFRRPWLRTFNIHIIFLLLWSIVRMVMRGLAPPVLASFPTLGCRLFPSVLPLLQGTSTFHCTGYYLLANVQVPKRMALSLEPAGWRGTIRFGTSTFLTHHNFLSIWWK